MNRLSQAIADFEDESLELSLGERMSRLREAIMFESFEKLKRSACRRSKTKAEIKADAEEEVRHLEITKWFKELEKMYTLQLRMNKLTGKTDDIMDKDFLIKVKETKSSIGDIVRDVQPISKN